MFNGKYTCNDDGRLGFPAVRFRRNNLFDWYRIECNTGGAVAPEFKLISRVYLKSKYSLYFVAYSCWLMLAYKKKQKHNEKLLDLH